MRKAVHLPPIEENHLLLNLENIYIFRLVVVGRFHSFTPSLGHFLLDIWNPWGELPYEEVRDARRKIWIRLLKKTNVGLTQAS